MVSYGPYRIVRFCRTLTVVTTMSVGMHAVGQASAACKDVPAYAESTARGSTRVCAITELN